MTYDEMYNLYHGVFITFEGVSKGKIKKYLSVRHGKVKRKKARTIFPYNEYRSYSREVFLLASLYVMFEKMPSSPDAGMELLRDTSKKDIHQFKDSIINFRRYIREDIDTLKEEFGTNISEKIVLEQYREKNIRWYTLWFYLQFKGSDINKIYESRINGVLLRRIQALLLFMSFEQESVQVVKEIMQDTLSF